MAKFKRYAKAAANVDANKIYSLKEAIALAKANATAKFDETIDVVLALNIDPKQSDQNVRGMISMPNGIGKTVRVAVFAKGEKVKEAQAAGADFVGGDDLADKITGGFTGFDRVIATPDMMGVVGKLGKVLGPKGLMPNPKLGTVTMNVTDAVKAAKSGQVEFKVEKAGLVHAGVAKASFSETAIEENIKALIGAIQKAKPASVKSNYIKKIGLSSSMGPGLKIDPATLEAA